MSEPYRYRINPEWPVTIGHVIAAWEPLQRPHCSNCGNCVVSGEPSNPEVHCAAGESTARRTLWQMIRQRHPLGFRSAATCPAYDSMGD